MHSRGIRPAIDRVSFDRLKANEMKTIIEIPISV